MREIKVIIKRPDEAYGHVEYIANELEDLQKIVGGYIETVSLLSNMVLIVNEEGKLMGLPYNFGTHDDILVGTVIVAGVKEDEFADVPIDLSQWKRMLLAWGN